MSKAKKEGASDTLELKHIAVHDLKPSRFNHRKTINEEELAELGESIRVNGILQPLNVRPIGTETQGEIDHYEIGGGERRWRAAVRLGLDFVPCIVKARDDKEFVTLINVENLQRADVHPLEEAEGYVDMMQVIGADVSKLATIVGKTEGYVRDRLQLLKLTATARELFRDGRFTLGHAIELSRQGSELQDKIVYVAPESHMRDGPLWERKMLGGLFTDEEQEKYEADPFFSLEPVTVKELKSWINDHVRFDIADQAILAFVPETAKAVLEAGRDEIKTIAITHSYRIEKDVKSGGRIYGPADWRRADGSDEDFPSCNAADMGVVVAGPHRGEMFAVCVDRKNCDTHFSEEIRQAKRNEKTSAAAAAGDAKAQQQIEKEKKKRATEDAKRARDQKIAALAGPIVRAAGESVIAKAKSADLGIKGRVGKYVLDSLEHREFWFGRDRRNQVPKTGSADAIVRTMAQFILKDGDDHHNALRSDAKALGVNVAKILKDATAQVAKEEKAAEKIAK